jgi:hypothetical protein
VSNADRTLAVAVAGIAATAVVGVAATTASWLSARDDRAAQRELARDERTYDRRVAAYLDAIDFFHKQQAAIGRVINVYCEAGCDDIPYPAIPPRRLVTRLRAFGSTPAIAAFQKTVGSSQNIPGMQVLESQIGDRYHVSYSFSGYSASHGKKFLTRYQAFGAQVKAFEEVVHGELGR